MPRGLKGLKRKMIVIKYGLILFLLILCLPIIIHIVKILTIVIIFCSPFIVAAVCIFIAVKIIKYLIRR